MWFQMFGATVANSGSERHMKYVENTMDMTVRVQHHFILQIITHYGCISYSCFIRGCPNRTTQSCDSLQ